jgi:hypothetical protein
LPNLSRTSEALLSVRSIVERDDIRLVKRQPSLYQSALNGERHVGRNGDSALFLREDKSPRHSRDLCSVAV